MKKYSGLLLEAAQRYCIEKGTHETEDEWKTRLIYSICGMMAYASLWDDSDEEPISLVHLKKKVRIMFSNYKAMYPEIARYLPSASEMLEDEIENQLIKAGVVYHCPNRVAPSMKREEAFGHILFQRGIAVDDISCVSGIGFYSREGKAANSDGLKAMFGLEQEKLQAVWSSALSAAAWETGLLFEQHTEYLRLRPPFSQGYWVNKPDTSGIVSILRTGMNGPKLYYLYRYSGTAIEASPLPQWQVKEHNYRSLACARLFAYGTLPPIEYAEDGALVHIRMNYLLPPRELEFLKLYSWPETCMNLPSDFKRKLSAEVFMAIKDILSENGYEFKGGTI